jgi:O-6-methylguanine DNA methyltransferase
VTLKKTEFTARVIAAVRRIPAGRVATYGDVAAMAGKPLAARAVGNIMRECSDRTVPAHRVVAAGGKLGGYGGDIHAKRTRLIAEGVIVAGATIRKFNAVRYSVRNRKTVRDS